MSPSFILVSVDKRDAIIKSLRTPNLGIVKMRWRVRKNSKHFRLEWVAMTDEEIKKTYA